MLEPPADVQSQARDDESQDAAKIRRQSPPPLELQEPLCGVCGNIVIDDAGEWACESCHASWPRHDVGDARGEWDEPHAAQCESIDGRFLPGGAWGDSNPDPTLYRCVLHAGHDAPSHEYTDGIGYVHRSWSDVNTARPYQIAAVSSGSAVTD